MKDNDNKVKEAKKKLRLNRSLSNNIFALSIIFKASPWRIFMQLLLSTTYGMMNFLTGSYLLRLIINAISNEKGTTYILIYICILFVIQSILSLISNYFWSIISPKQNNKINEEINIMLYDKSCEVEYACYDNPEFYDKHIKAMDAASEHIWGVLSTLDGFILRIVTLFSNSLMIFIIDPRLMAFALFPLLLGFVKKKSKKLKHDYDVSQKPYTRRKKYIQRAFYLPDYAKEIRLLNMWRSLINDWWENFELYKVNLRKYGWRRAVTEYISIIGLDVITIIGATFYSVYNTLISGNMLVGDCIVVINSIADISYSLSNIVTDITAFSEHAIYLEDFRSFIEYEPKIKANHDGKLAKSGDIVFDNVSFSYNDLGNNTLKNISFKIKKGERIALVGQNGSGKTTLLKLLLYLYEPTAGKIMLNGMNIHDYNLKSYRSLYSVVFQDYRNFSMTVAENVLMKETINNNEHKIVIDSLKKAGIYEKIMSLPHGIDTVLTREFDNDGAILSGGESQKISLARVFAEQHDIAILDEPTSALDPIAEYNMFENMMKATEDKTVIFISHRMSFTTLADRIFLMDGGELVECGTHDELMKYGGLYSEMYNKQAKNYLDKQVTA